MIILTRLEPLYGDPKRDNSTCAIFPLFTTVRSSTNGIDHVADLVVLLILQFGREISHHYPRPSSPRLIRMADALNARLPLLLINLPFQVPKGSTAK